MLLTLRATLKKTRKPSKVNQCQVYNLLLAAKYVSPVPFGAGFFILNDRVILENSDLLAQFQIVNESYPIYPYGSQYNQIFQIGVWFKAEFVYYRKVLNFTVGSFFN